MAHERIIRSFAASALALVALGGCASGFNADVSRFQQLPAPQGQTFVMVADDPRLAGGLEFSQYASLVAAKLGSAGFTATRDPASADMIVRLRYDVDKGQQKIRSTGFADSYYGRFGYYGLGYRGWGYPYHWGFHDPFLFGPGYRDIESYLVFTSTLELKIDRADGTRVFEGKASAQSLSDKLTYLVPKLIDAMFTNFPGNSGESVQITVPPEKK